MVRARSFIRVPSRTWYFAFFFSSGACSLVFEVIWLRLAMAKFGVTTPLVSIVLSLFMAGLAIGSGFAGRLDRMLPDRPANRFLRLYALSEMVIGLSAFVVPPALAWGGAAVSAAGGAWGSLSFYLASALVIGAAILPFCVCMGATFPLAMSFIRRIEAGDGRAFSYLYLANLLGACAGTLASAFVLIELLGFRRTLAVTAALNALVAAAALALSRDATLGRDAAPGDTAALQSPGAPAPAPAPGPRTPAGPPGLRGGAALLGLLFLTGLVSLAMEVVWVRQFTPLLGPLVYSFAAILAFYLAFNALGARLYRGWSSSRILASSPARVPSQADGADGNEERVRSLALIGAGAFSFLPLLAADPRLPLAGTVLVRVLQLALGLGPFCVALGFLTPLLVDRFAGGDPDRAGRAYAVNVLGCILGPLLAGFALLPLVGERATLVTLGLPLLGLGLWAALWPGRRSAPMPGRPTADAVGTGLALKAVAWSALALAGLLLFATEDFESLFPRSVIRRDYAATIVATGEGMKKQLYVNGYGITSLTPITKMMAHLPAAFRTSPPRNSLVICFGMGTTFRSLLSWGAPTTAVELIPSVPDLFSYYHPDGPGLLRSPLAEIVIDDGRRFLERTPAEYDVITIDPPPPVEAAASSLLYSRDFYAVVRKRLRAGGIVQQWLPEGDRAVLSSVSRALRESFPFVRAFRSVEGWGIHYLASASPIGSAPASTLAGRLPPRAAADLLEWGPYETAERQFATVLEGELSLEALVAADPRAPALQDDRPVNEYYLVRRALGRSGRLPP